MMTLRDLLEVSGEDWRNMEIRMNDGVYLIADLPMEWEQPWINSYNNLTNITENTLTFTLEDGREMSLNMEDFMSSRILDLKIDYGCEQFKLVLLTTGFFPVER